MGRARRWLAVGSAVLLSVSIGVPDAWAAPDPGRFTASAVAPSGEPITVAKSVTGRLAQSDPELLARTDGASTTVMVKLDYDAAAAYTGGVDGLAATSPSTTGKPLDVADPAVSGYLDYAKGVTDQAAAAITAAVPEATVGQSFSLVYGGLAVTVPADKAKALLAVPGVAAVQQDRLVQPDRTDTSASAAAASVSASVAASVGEATVSATTSATGSTSPPTDTAAFIGADKVWPSLGGRDKAGSGVIVGVLDTGIWPEHPMLADKGLPAPKPTLDGSARDCDFGDGTDPDLGPAFTCNNKLIGAYTFVQTYLQQNGGTPAGSYCPSTDRCSARDSDGHGTHTATTAAGDHVDSAPVLGVDRGPISGIAPGASVISYRVCLELGCYGSDSVQAVQRAIIDRVDVINFSIGGGASAYSDPVELAFLDAYKAGILVSASAGNDGPDDATAEHSGPWVLTVAASTANRSFASTLTLTAADGATYTKAGSTITAGVSGPVVKGADVPGYTGGTQCSTAFAAGSVAGKIVVCERGGIGRVQKGYNALQGGAIGLILYNPMLMDTETDNHFLPAIHLEGPNDALLAFLAAHGDVTASWPAGQVQASQGDVMAGFSSRGPVGEFIKPDITAPGVQVLAGNTPTPNEIPAGTPGQLYQAIAGTSMSSPHTAGASALIKAAHPDWTPGQIKSAQMTSSVQDVVNADGSPAGIWDRGAGSLRVDRAVKPTVTFDVTGAAYTASVADPLHRVDLNLPSIKVDPLPGAIQVTRTLTNVSGKAQTFTASATADAGLGITVSPNRFRVPAGGSATITVVLDGLKATDGDTLTGQITLKPSAGGASPVVLPVAATIGQAPISLAQSCTPTTIKVFATTTCSVTATNTLPVEAPVSMQTLGTMWAQSATAPAKRNWFGASWSGTLAAAVAPEIRTISAGAGPAGGYLPLSAFGIAPVAGLGDETIVNFDVPGFLWGGESYDKVGVDTNGYIVVGGGTSADNNCCDPALRSTAPPNNVIAPYWTDLSLDPASGGGEVRVGTLTDGTTSWLVVDYSKVKAYGSALENTFQIWIQLGSTEGTWLSYGSIGGANGQPLVIGAENRTGSSGVTRPSVASDSEYAITTSPPVFSTASYSVTFRSLFAGKNTVATIMRSPAIRATAIASTTITVTR